MTTNQLFTTITQAEDNIRAILGDHADQHDIEAITRTVTYWDDATTGTVTRVDRQGFRWRTRFLDDQDAFWQVVADHALETGE